MKRYEKIVLEAEKGITFEVSEETSGEVIIRALNIATTGVDLSFQTESTEKYAELQIESARECAEPQTESAGECAEPKTESTEKYAEPQTESAEKYAELPTESVGEYAEILSAYTDNDGNKAVVPPGWTVSGVCKENTIWGKDVSLVIYRIPKEKVSSINWEDMDVVEGLKRTYDQLVWAPVELLDANGTLDGVSFTEKFGRRNYLDIEFSKGGFYGGYYETLTDEFALQLESVKKYGGFYISRYNISKSSAGKPQSVKGVMPWVMINFDDTKEVASTIENNEAVKSHLTFGAEFDSVLEWFIKSKARTRSEIEHSTNWGNHWYTKNSPRRVVETGSREEWCTNNICDFAGNVQEWTQEQHGDHLPVVRGGSYYISTYPVAFRFYNYHYQSFEDIGFRAVLYIK